MSAGIFSSPVKEKIIDMTALCGNKKNRNLPGHRTNHDLIFEPTCAYARWALMHRIAYVCDLTKIQTRS